MISVVVDTETTGLLYPSIADLNQQPKIIELGIARVEDGNVAKRFNVLIDPGETIDATITKITGINNDDLKGKPAFKDIIPDIRLLFEGADEFIAHNAEFDKQMIVNEARRTNEMIVFPPETTCSVSEFYHIFGRRPKLTDLYLHFMKRPLAQTHRAIEDVDALVEILKAINYWG